MGQSETASRNAPRSGNGAGGRAHPDNVIILTGGLTGSSALAGLLSAAGYWSGEETFKKQDYNTYENAELIRLNRQLMEKVSASEEYTAKFLPDAIRDIEELAETEDGSEYRALVTDCESNRPWMWKDPRLWMTIRFWKSMVPWDRTKVLLLRRDPMQSWISCTQRRQIQTRTYLRSYNDAIQVSLRQFLDDNSIQYLPVLFEDLILTPEQEVKRIGDFLALPVTMEHLKSTYSGALYRRPKSYGDALEAFLIYVKNYRERLR